MSDVGNSTNEFSTTAMKVLVCNAGNIKVNCERPRSQNAYITVSIKPVLRSASPGEVHCPVHIDLDLNIVIHTEAMRVNVFNMTNGEKHK